MNDVGALCKQFCLNSLLTLQIYDFMCSYVDLQRGHYTPKSKIICQETELRMVTCYSLTELGNCG